MRFVSRILIVPLAAGVLLSQEPTATVSGRVLKYSTREPVADVTVELIRETGSPAPGNPALASPRIVANTNADGAFTLQGAPPGQYRIYATALNGYLPAEYGQRSSTGLGMPITLTAGQQLSGVTLTMTPTASITGRITDGEGNPVVYANVMAGRVVYRDGVRTLEGAQSSLTNDRGEYRIFWLAPGAYTLTAIPLEMRQYTMPATPAARFGGREHLSLPLIALKPGPDGVPVEVTYMPSYYPGVADLRSSQPIIVHAGETVRADINAAASEVPSLRVRGVISGGGEGARSSAGVQVTLVPRFVEGHSVQPPAASADAEGVFDIHGVVPGSYLLFAGTAVTPVEVADRNVENVRVQMFSQALIPWRVTVEGDSNGSPSSLQVSLTRDPPVVGAPRGGIGISTAPRGARAPQTGLVTGMGDYRVNVSGLPSGTYVKSIRLGGDDVLRDGLHVYGPIANTLEIDLGARAGQLDGVVVDDQGRPFINAAIALVPPLGQRQSRLDLYKTTASGADGRFRIDGITPGEYKLFAWEDVQTGDWYNPDFMRKEDLRGQTVRVSEGPSKSIVIRVIPAEGDIR
ncbi:MAG TPA: carboxypeptidase-like regulatory domain-containing protein [Terriglobia bacterium]|nr:carboxypeptidase-like regulatory domain-containing protein [Terriglobia bacterium]